MNAHDEQIDRLLHSFSVGAAAHFAHNGGLALLREGLRALREDPEEARRIDTLATELDETREPAAHKAHERPSTPRADLEDAPFPWQPVEDRTATTAPPIMPSAEVRAGKHAEVRSECRARILSATRRNVRPRKPRSTCMTDTNLPPQGAVFWPVGTGDSTTLVIDDQLVMQVDLRDMKAADADGAVVSAVIDRLAEKLPQLEDGTPYLAAFALTHADLDHCCGFGDLLDSDILIGELWVTPRLWREASEDEELGEEATRFHAEAQRRVTATLKALEAGREPVSGERIRVIGYDDDRTEHDYAALPEQCFTFPGQAVTTLDGVDVADRFEAFIHAPFRDDCAGERNETSLAMQITLRAPDGAEGRLLLMGDLSYVTLKKIFDFSEAKGRPERLAWDVFLAPHHCSRKVMYVAGENGQEELKQDLLDQLEAHAEPNARIIASSLPFREKDEPGYNPPHLLARDRYEEIVEEGVLCTGEYPDEASPRPIVFGLEPGRGLELLDIEQLEESEEQLSKSAGGARLLVALGLTAATVAGTAAARQHAQRSGTQDVRSAAERTRGEGAAPAASVGFGHA